MASRAAGVGAAVGSPYAGGVRATWWYTVAGLVFLDLVVLMNWWLWLGQLPAHAVLPGGPALAALGVALQLGAAAVLVRDYPVAVRPADAEDTVTAPRRRRGAVALAVGAAGAALLGVTTGSWMLGVGVLAFLLSLLPWPGGVRWRLVALLTLVLAGLWVVDAPRLGIDTADADLSTLPPTLILLLPALSAFSLWWWDLVRELDRAREAAAAVSAMRERLRLAGEVHDLQGHHLQVVALQLELAERLIDRDPAAAAEQIRTARASVDEARAGTRDLATRFRGVPLPDELANAADLLRAAGHEVQVELDRGAERAPADVLGPLVRESVTNVLKHGAGRRARISLRREGGMWRYAIANDRDPATPGAAASRGTGVAAMRDRIAALGGTVEVRADDEFVLTVAVPDGARPDAVDGTGA
ncbi:histidine kinase [Cellulomonas sp. ACRRI]|uniref:sensor histidine kinase n=1 Tax=Cellulomonas sp. ACRRI TaxID=2918188 RepID=UPI001EF3A90E|nr:histidine kinase [Cellulomonas sp. ACRRI]MCG7286874.1 histidine kinase [Cellulomonas sp. ACRRI]